MSYSACRIGPSVSYWFHGNATCHVALRCTSLQRGEAVRRPPVRARGGRQPAFLTCVCLSVCVCVRARAVAPSPQLNVLFCMPNRTKCIQMNSGAVAPLPGNVGGAEIPRRRRLGRQTEHAHPGGPILWEGGRRLQAPARCVSVGLSVCQSVKRACVVAGAPGRDCGAPRGRRARPT
jgi:hypothetical protein